MSDATQATQPLPSYGYESDEVKVSPFKFGLNANNTYLTKFEWIPNAGADGAPGEALEIIFNINGADKSARTFPVTKAFGKNKEEITDPNSQEMKDAFRNFNSVITHILHTFQSLEVIKATLARPIPDFKTYCGIVASLLPKDFAKIKLDIFMHYQWEIGKNNTRTFLELPKKMTQGSWLCKSTGEEWEEVKMEKPKDDERGALKYVTYKTILPVPATEPTKEIDKVHLFTRSGWFLNSNFAKLQSIATKQTTSPVDAIAAGAGQATVASTETW